MQQTNKVNVMVSKVGAGNSLQNIACAMPIAMKRHRIAALAAWPRMAELKEMAPAAVRRAA